MFRVFCKLVCTCETKNHEIECVVCISMQHYWKIAELEPWNFYAAGFCELSQSAILAKTLVPTTPHKTHIQSCKRYSQTVHAQVYLFISLSLTTFTVSHIVTIFHYCYSYSSYCHACHLLCKPFTCIFHCPLTALHTHNGCSYTLVPRPVEVAVLWRGWERLEPPPPLPPNFLCPTSRYILGRYEISLISSYLELDHVCTTWSMKGTMKRQKS